MLGVTVNAAAVLLGTLLGLGLKKILKENITKAVMQALGVGVIAIGIIDVVKTENVLVLILSLTVGGLLGALCRLQDRLDRFGAFLERKLVKNVPEEGTGTVGAAFVNGTLIFCVGAMAIYGSIEAGLGDNSTLYVKSVLDGVMAMLIAATLGWGVVLSAIPLFVLQGSFALTAGLLSPVVNDAFMNQLSGIGGALVICIGINILKIKEIRTADFLPALLGCIVMLFL